MILELILLSHALQAGEPDNFSARLDSSAPIANTSINDVVNSVLSLAIYESNGRRKKCDRSALTNILKDELDRNWPNITKYVYLNAPFAGPNSYSKVPYLGTIPYGRTTYSPSTKVQVGDDTFYIGIDKIDHFFSHGFLYWNLVDQDPKLPAAKVKNALNLGTAQEEGPWGLQFTGVKSYADMSANYKGMSFWRDLLDGSPALIECVDNKFVLKNKFAMENYFDASMDETINCDSYAKQEMLDSIKSFTDQKKVSCPVSSATCEKFVKNYPSEVAAKILHPLCRKTGTSQIEVASKLSSKDIIDGVQGVLSGGDNLFEMFFPPKKNTNSDNNTGGVMEK
jgi:hypothetical protein